VVWMLCRQNPLNIPAYLTNSWFISQGYQEAMGITGPDKPFWTGLVVVTILLIYLTHYWLTQKERPRATAYSAILVALLYLGWKHGFIRADGHMIGFFYSALLAIVTYPILLGDNQPTAHWPNRNTRHATRSRRFSLRYLPTPDLEKYRIRRAA
jgi:peptidoglycan/LPS O-acetylase OafA/YrhL